MDVEGKVAIITGGGTGVGRATALDLARRGCSVVVNYSRSKDDAEATAAEVARARRARPARSAPTSPTTPRAARWSTPRVRELGRVDVLVQSAGVTSFIPHANLDAVRVDDWQRILGVNLIGAFQMARAVKAPMDAAGAGAIVNVSSVAGIAGVGSSIPYCASKAGDEQPDDHAGARARAEDPRERGGAGLHHGALARRRARRRPTSRSRRRWRRSRRSAAWRTRRTCRPRSCR